MSHYLLIAIAFPATVAVADLVANIVAGGSTVLT